jgi:hypothetical protein
VHFAHTIYVCHIIFNACWLLAWEVLIGWSVWRRWAAFFERYEYISYTNSKHSSSCLCRPLTAEVSITGEVHVGLVLNSDSGADFSPSTSDFVQLVTFNQYSIIIFILTLLLLAEQALGAWDFEKVLSRIPKITEQRNPFSLMSVD